MLFSNANFIFCLPELVLEKNLLDDEIRHSFFLHCVIVLQEIKKGMMK